MLRSRFPHWLPYQVHLTLEGSGPSFFDHLAEAPKNGRRGEIVMALCNSDGLLWLHTKRFYPAGIYRLPTGGLLQDEDIFHAVQRECREETGFTADIQDCLGSIYCAMSRKSHTIHFISHVLLLATGDRLPAPEDAHEEITDFFAVSPQHLSLVANVLRRVPTDWQHWGHFRAIAHDFIADRWQQLELPTGSYHHHHHGNVHCEKAERSSCSHTSAGGCNSCSLSGR